MANLQTISTLVPEPDKREKVLKRYQNTQDIIKDLIFCFKAFNHQAQPIAKHFYTGSTRGDAKKIYDFIQKNFTYDAEPERLQTTRSFSRIIHDGNSHTIDCKHNALIASCIAWQMGYNVIFRFVSYTPGTNYGHVYVLIQAPDEKEKFVIDPLQPFNYEKSFYSHKDYEALQTKKNKKMLSRLTGVEPQRLTRNGLEIYTDSMGEIKLFKKVADAVKSAVKNPGAAVKKVYLSPVRGAGLLLIDVNFRNFAGRLATLMQRNPAAIDNLVKTFNFDKNTLINTINKGKNKPKLFGGKTSGIGEPTTVAAAITAAAPIIIALTKIFKQNNLPEQGDGEAEAQAAADLKNLPNENLGAGSGGGFLDSIPTPVKYIGGALLIGGAAYGINKIVNK